MLKLQLGSFSIKAVYQVRKFHLLSSLKLLLGITWQERLVLLADCWETLFPLTELVTVSWFILTSRSPASSIPRHVQNNMTLGLSGHFSTFGLVFFVLKCLLGIDNGIVKNLQFCPPNRGIMLEF